MNQQTLEHLLSSLNKKDFYKLLLPLLKSFFSLSKKKESLYEYNYTQSYFFQDTSELIVAVCFDVDLAEGWQQNIINTLTSFRISPKPQRCLFFTNHNLSPAILTEFCNELLMIIHIPVAAYSRYEIASMILEAGLISDITGILIKNIPESHYKTDYKLLFLHSCYDLSPDQIFARNYILDFTLMSLLFSSKSPLDRSSLCLKALRFLNDEETELPKHNRRIDSLLTRAKIIKNGNDLILADEEMMNFHSAEVLFKSELEEVSAIISRYFVPDLKTWDRKKSFKAAFLITRYFLHSQLISARYLRFSTYLKDVFDISYDPWSKLRKMLIENGIHADAVNTALLDICSQLKNHSLIVKICHIFTTIMLESVPSEKKAFLFQAPNWQRVNVYLDTSVAVQFLCANLFMPLINHNSAFAERIVNTLKQVNASILITHTYLQEITSFLIQATSYTALPKQSSKARNPFVEFYLKYMHQSDNNALTFKKYLNVFAKSSIRNDLNREFQMRETSNELKRLLYTSGINIEEYPEPSDDEITLAREIFLYTLSNTQKKINKTVINRNVSNMIFLKNNSLDNHQPQIFLTWDKLLLQYAYHFHYYNYATFSTPQMLSDILQIHVQLDDKELITLVYNLSRIIRKPQAFMRRINENIFSEINSDQQKYIYKEELLHNQRYTLKRTIEDLPYDPDEDSDPEEPPDNQSN